MKRMWLARCDFKLSCSPDDEVYVADVLREVKR